MHCIELLLGNLNKSLALDGASPFPLIAIMAASSTRAVVTPTVKSMALFHYLLPSLTTSLDCGFRYVFILGYDEGDVFYDSPRVSWWVNKGVMFGYSCSYVIHTILLDILVILTVPCSGHLLQGMNKTLDWFENRVRVPMKKRNILLTIVPLKSTYCVLDSISHVILVWCCRWKKAVTCFNLRDAVANTLRKPGPVFLAMGKEAYSLGADFMYRVCDLLNGYYLDII